MSENLKKYRDQIDDIDKKMLELLERRAQVVLKVGKAKTAKNDKPVFYRPEREAQMFREKMKGYQGSIPKADVLRVYRSILSACRALEYRGRFVCLGPKGTFSHAATVKHFGSNIDILFVNSLTQIFQEVENDKAGYGVVPIENSTSGMIAEVADALFKFGVKICGEVFLPINFHLLRSADASDQLLRIYGHIQAKKQCSTWLANTMANVEFIECSSSTDAVQKMLDDEDSAALASEFAEITYDLVRHASNLENERHNKTRFLIIGKQDVIGTGCDKTAIVLNLNDSPGELFQVLQVFAKQKINLNLIESRPPQDKKWRHQFYIEFEGHIENEAVATALYIFEKSSLSVRVLGSFPRAIVEES